jgi:hypothetical protein
LSPRTDLLLRSFDVAAFRGIESVSFGHLARINLLVGGNNSGKTSVLEALAVYSSPLDVAEWSSIARTREVRNVPTAVGGSLSNIEAIRWLFPVRKMDESLGERSRDFLLSLSISGSGRWHVNHLYAECVPIRGFPPTTTIRALRMREVEAEVPAEDEGWRISARIESDGLPADDSEQNVEIELWPSIGFWRPERRSKVHVPAVMLAPYSHRNQPLQLRRLSRLIEEGSKGHLVEMLRGFDQRIVDLEIVTDRSTGSPTIAVRQLNSTLLPASVMGDGFRRALMIAVALTQARNGLLLIDEIETALHVSVLDKLFSWLTDACETYDVQLFATTHSLEAVTAILKAIPETARDVLTAYHLGATEARPQPPKRYSADMMLRLIRDRGLDIR